MVKFTPHTGFHGVVNTDCQVENTLWVEMKLSVSLPYQDTIWPGWAMRMYYIDEQVG